MELQTQNSNLTIFIGGLPGLTKKQDLLAEFTRYGEIASIKLHTNLNSKLNKGYALITFEEAEAYKSALKIPELCFMSRTISCQPYLQGSDLTRYLEDLNSRRIFVKYVPKSYNNQVLYSIFEKYGDLEFAYVVKDPRTFRSKGFGYVAFKLPEIARKVEKMKSIKLVGKKKMKIFPYKRRGEVKNNHQTGEVIRTKLNSIVEIPKKKINFEKPGCKKWIESFNSDENYRHCDENLKLNRGNIEIKKIEPKKDLGESRANNLKLLDLQFILPLQNRDLSKKSRVLYSTFFDM